MTEAPAFERLLKRDRLITLAGLSALCVLAWLYVVTGSGLGMSMSAMTTLALFPHQQAQDVMSGMSASWDLKLWVLMIAMWWIMMIAMMTPSAAPTILLYARVHRYELGRGNVQSPTAPTGAFAAGYVLVWLGFSVAATVLHWALERAGLVSAMMMGSRSQWLSGGVLIAAGLYELSPSKHVCLAHCRSPTAFLSRHWRPLASGAFRLGAMHGTHCVGCCWMLMALLFVGGVMNLVWIAALAVIVLIEKLLPAGRWISRAIGVVLIGWGIVTFLIPSSALAAEWEGYQRLTREQLLAVIADTAQGAKPELKAKNLSEVDLSGVDFRGADLSASVLNGAKLEKAKLDRCNLTVSFLEGANLASASLRDAVLFSTQLAGADLSGADLTGARLIGDLRKANLSKAKLLRMNAAPDMKNQSMGLMRANIVSAQAIEADFSDADFSRTDFSFSDLSRAKMVRTKLRRADLSGVILKGADLTDADLRDSILIDTDFSSANLTNADFTGATFRGVRGLDTATRTGARGLPEGGH